MRFPAKEVWGVNLHRGFKSLRLRQQGPRLCGGLTVALNTRRAGRQELRRSDHAPREGRRPAALSPLAAPALSPNRPRLLCRFQGQSGLGGAVFALKTAGAKRQEALLMAAVVGVRCGRVSGVWGTRACESLGGAGVIRAGVSGAPRSGAGQGEELAELAPALQARVSGRRAAAAIGAMPALGARRALPAPLHRAPAQGTPAGADASSSRPKRMNRALSRNLPHRAPGPRRHRLLIAMPMESQTLSNASLTLSPTTARKRHMGGGVSANTPAM